MRRFFIFTATLLLYSVTITAQDSTYTSNTDIGIFENSKGIFVKREYFSAGQIKLFKFEVVKFTNLKTNNIIYGVYLEKTKNNAYRTLLASAYIDSSECRSIEEFLKYIKANCVNKTEVYTTYKFTSKDDFIVGAEAKAGGNWRFFLRLKRMYIDYNDEVSYFTNEKVLDELITIFNDINTAFRRKQ